MNNLKGFQVFIYKRMRLVSFRLVKVLGCLMPFLLVSCMVSYLIAGHISSECFIVFMMITKWDFVAFLVDLRLKNWLIQVVFWLGFISLTIFSTMNSFYIKFIYHNQWKLSFSSFSNDSCLVSSSYELLWIFSNIRLKIKKEKILI